MTTAGAVAECEGCRINRLAGFAGDLEDWFVYRSDRWTINHRVIAVDGEPQLSAEHGGWFVLQPRQHVTSMADLDEVQLKEFGILSGRLSNAMRKVYGDEYRIYIASLGTDDVHVHFHFIPTADIYGPELFHNYTPLLSPEEAVQRIRGVLPRSPHGPSQERGLAALVGTGVTWVRAYSPYHLVRRALSHARGMRYLAAEFYSFLWLVILGLGVAGGSVGPKWLALIAAVLATIRVIDISATQTGILLYESQRSSFAGVQSIARSVLLALVNLAEVTLVTATWTVAVVRFSPGAYEPVQHLGLRSVLDSLQPLGGEGLTPVSSLAQAVDIAQISLSFYVTVVLLGGVLGNIGAQLSGNSDL